MRRFAFITAVALALGLAWVWTSRASSHGPVRVRAGAAVLPHAQRALLAFQAANPEALIELGAFPDERADLELIPAAPGQTPLFYQASLLLVDPLAPLENLSLARARALLEGTDPEGELVLVPLATVRERGYLRPGEVTVGDYADRTVWMRPLLVDGVEPDFEHLSSGRYPLSTAVALRRPAARWWRWGRGTPAADFVAFLTSRAGQEALYGWEQEAVLLAVGDVMLSRHVAAKMAENGPDYPFERVRGLLSSAELVFANLESPIGTRGQPIPGKLIWFRAPPEAAGALARAGVHVVALANNHILDYDSENLVETLELLDAHEIARTGAGRDLDEARRPAILERNGITIAFLSYTEFASANLFWSFAYPRTFLAAPGVPGCAPLDLDMVAEDVAAARQRADIVVVAYHWGQEYVNEPEAFWAHNDLRDLARRTVDAGAHLVIGTHPHAIQGLEFYSGGLIAYSLGNFVMDQTRPITTESMALRITVTRGGPVGLHVIPVRISEHRPALATGGDATYLMQKLREISAPLRP